MNGDKDNTKQHKYSRLIKAWADGKAIEKWSDLRKVWNIDPNPTWSDSAEYRIKEPDIVQLVFSHNRSIWNAPDGEANLRLTYDSTTGKLIAAEIIK